MKTAGSIIVFSPSWRTIKPMISSGGQHPSRTSIYCASLSTPHGPKSTAAEIIEDPSRMNALNASSLSVKVQFSLYCELLRIFKRAKPSTDTATPTNPAKNIKVDSRSIQSFPTDQNRMTPSRNAEMVDRVHQGLLLFISILSRPAIMTVDQKS